MNNKFQKVKEWIYDHIAFNELAPELIDLIVEAVLPELWEPNETPMDKMALKMIKYNRQFTLSAAEELKQYLTQEDGM